WLTAKNLAVFFRPFLRPSVYFRPFILVVQKIDRLADRPNDRKKSSVLTYNLNKQPYYSELFKSHQSWVKSRL
ncbi:hypothetical protein BpHYR1_043045, partial [Brachionus plicatilis]